MTPSQALLSVSDKRGITEFARGLIELGFELVSTGGTRETLLAAGITVRSVSDLTGFPEILGGRVKTLHPVIHGGLLGMPDHQKHAEQMAAHGIEAFALLAVNLYPFEATISAESVTFADAIEQIDIGGPAMLRAAAKNFAHVIPVCNPSDYDDVLTRIRNKNDTGDWRQEMAAKVFSHTSFYDSLVARWLSDDDVDNANFPGEWRLAGRKAMDLRYGENPQQAAAAYRVTNANATGLLDAVQLGGKELSYNNLLDGDAAWGVVTEWTEPTVAIVKHTIPCGLAVRNSVADAFAAALAGDPVSAFGGIVASNSPIDRDTAEQIRDIFFEVVLAPDFSDEALAILAQKKQLRLLRMPAASLAGDVEQLMVRSIRGGLLVQQADASSAGTGEWRVVTQKHPTEEQFCDLRFAWRAVRHVKSNAVVLAHDRALVGVGSGQPNRLASIRIAVLKAGERAARSVLASDAFFPFADNIDALVKAGIAAVVQPGGSVRDEEVIARANEAGIAMVFTGVRHFLH